MLRQIQILHEENNQLKLSFGIVSNNQEQVVKELKNEQLPNLRKSVEEVRDKIYQQTRNPVNYNFGDKTITTTLTEAQMLTELKTSNFKTNRVDLNNPARVRGVLKRVIERLRYYESKIGKEEINLNLKWISRALFEGTQLQDCGCTLPTWQDMLERVSTLLGATEDMYAVELTKRLLEYQPQVGESLRLALIKYSAIIEKLVREDVLLPSMVLMVDKVRQWLPASVQLPADIILLQRHSTPLEFMTAVEKLIVGMSPTLLYKGRRPMYADRQPERQERQERTIHRYNNRTENKPKRDEKDINTVKCFICEKMGHYAIKCPNKPKKTEGHVKVGAVEAYGEKIVGASTVSVDPMRIYVDTMAGYNVVNSTLAALSKPLHKLKLVKGINTKPQQMNTVLTTVKLPRGPMLTYEAVVDNSRGAINLIRPDIGTLFGTSFQFNGTEIESVMDREKNALYIHAVPITARGALQSRSVVQQKLQSVFNVACPTWDDDTLYNLGVQIHKWLGCAGTDIISKTLRTHGCALPMRIIDASVRMCTRCKPTTPQYNQKHMELIDVAQNRPAVEQGAILHVDIAVFNSKEELVEEVDEEEPIAMTRQQKKEQNWKRMKRLLDTSVLEKEDNKAKFFLVGVIHPGGYYKIEVLIQKGAAKEVMLEWVKEFPNIKRIQSDQAREFITAAKEIGIHLTTSEVGEKNTNAIAEVAVRIAKKVLFALQDDHKHLGKNWEFFARSAGYTINARTNSNGVCPFQAMFGKLPTIKMVAGRKVSIRTVDGYVEGLSLGEFRPKQFDVWNKRTDEIEEKHAVVL